MGEEQLPQAAPDQQPPEAQAQEGQVSDALHRSLADHPIGELPNVARLHPEDEAETLDDKKEK